MYTTWRRRWCKKWMMGELRLACGSLARSSRPWGLGLVQTRKLQMCFGTWSLVPVMVMGWRRESASLTHFSSSRHFLILQDLQKLMDFCEHMACWMKCGRHMKKQRTRVASWTWLCIRFWWMPIVNVDPASRRSSDLLRKSIVGTSKAIWVMRQTMRWRESSSLCLKELTAIATRYCNCWNEGGLMYSLVG